MKDTVLEWSNADKINRFLKFLSHDIEKKVEIICFSYLIDCIMVCIMRDGEYVFIEWIDAEKILPHLEKVWEEKVISIEYKDPLANEILVAYEEREDEKNDWHTCRMSEELFKILDNDTGNEIEVVRIYRGHGDYSIHLLKDGMVVYEMYSYNYQSYLISNCVLPKIEKGMQITHLLRTDDRVCEIAKMPRTTTTRRKS